MITMATITARTIPDPTAITAITQISRPRMRDNEKQAVKKYHYVFSIPEDVVPVVPDVGVVVLGEVVLGVVVVVEEGTGIDGVGVGRVIANKERRQYIVLFINILLYM